MQSVSEWVQERLKAVRQRTTKAWKTINRESTPKAIVIINLRELYDVQLPTYAQSGSHFTNFCLWSFQ